MDNDDKPFVCPAPDCGQRFTNSDHLSVHQQKHQLSLNIGLRQGESLIDQTPTPTRFLPKTTEEGGELFEGLAESNPFDQDFKKAALSHVPSAPTSVLLPVISVSPPEPSTTDVTKTTASNVRFSSEKKCILRHPNRRRLLAIRSTSRRPPELLKSIPQTNIKILDVHSGQTKKIQEGGAGNVTIVVNTQKSLSRVNPASILNSKRPTTVLIQGQSNIQPIIINQELRASGGVMPMIGIKTSSGNGSGRAAVPHPAIVMSRSHQNGTTDLKQRLKEVIQQNATASSSSPSPKSRPSPNHSMQHSSASSPSNSVKSDNSDMMNEDFDEDMKGVPSKRSRRSQEDLDPDERRQKFLERNRAAASRCRQKRKVWVQQLEKKADDLSSTNVALQNEISVLRTEVAQLKALLLAHKDCPITMQQQKALIKQTNPNFGDQSESSIVAVTSLNQQRFETAEEVASSALTDMANQGQLVEPCKGRSMTANISIANFSELDKCTNLTYADQCTALEILEGYSSPREELKFVNVMADILKLGKEKAASQVIGDVQKGRGTRLLESILDSLLGEQFDEDKSVWCLWLLSGGKEPYEFLKALKKQNSSPVCGLVWNEQFVAYRCRDCAISPCMSLCADCFVAGNHEGHDFNMFRSKAGGACDCGDENVMRKQGFCSKHGSEKTPKEVTLPMDLDVIAKCLVPRLFLKINEDFQTRSNEGLGSSSYLPPSLEKLIKLLQMICEADAFRNLTAKVILQTIPKSMTPKKSKQNSGQTVASRLKPTNSTASGHTLVHSVPSSPPAFDFMSREDNFAILDHSDINPLRDVNLESGTCSYLEILMQTLVKYEFPSSLATFMLLLLPEHAYKESFTRSFCRNYVAIGQSLPHSRRPDLLSNHLVHVSVQLFSSEALATTMVREEKLLYTLVGVLVDMIGGCLQSYEYNFEGKVTSVLVADCDHRILINHCYWPIASDLLNILSHKQVVKEFLKNDTIIHQWMYLVTLLTGMNVNNRRIASHIQFEPRTYITSFSVEFESVAAVVWELLRGCEKLKEENDRYVLKLIKATENALRDWYNFVPVRPSKSTATFHLSLHRYLALFISQAIVRFGLNESDALPSLDFLLQCVEYPLRTLVAVSEIKAGYWVYSGFQMRGQALSYVQCHFCNSMVDVDLFFVQILASKVDANFFLKLLIERFSLGAWFQFGKPVADSPQRQDIDKENSMVESFLSFILILVSQRVLSGMSDTCQGHKDLAALLCVSNKTHSQLTELMADFKAPTLDEDVMQQGTYSPKDSVWDQDFDYVHVLHRFFMPSEYQKASQRYTENMRQRGTTVHSHCWPPFKDLSEIHPCFKGIFRLVKTAFGKDNYYHYYQAFCLEAVLLIYVELYKDSSSDILTYDAVKNVNSVTELMLVNTMHLLHLALRTPKVTDEGVIPNTEHFKSKKVTLLTKCVDYLEKFVDQPGGLYGTGEREFRELNTVLYNKLTEDEGYRLDQESCEPRDVATILQHVLFSKNKLSFFEPMLAYMDNVVADGNSQESFEARRQHHLQYLLSIIPEDRYQLLKKLFSHWRKCTSKDNVKITSYSFCMQRKEICNVRPNQPKTVLDIGFKNQSIIENASVPVCSLDDGLPRTGEQIAETEDLGKKESLLSLLVALLAKLKEASKFVQTKRSSDKAMDDQDIRAGDGTYRVTELLQELHESSAKNQAIIDRLAPKIGRSDGQNKRSGVADDSLSERLDRRKKAMARQKKILEEFMTKQEMFKEQHMSIDMDVDDGSKSEIVVSERQFDCVICGQTSHSTVDRPFGVSVLMQPSTGQRRNESIDLLPLEDKKYSLTCGRVCEQRKEALLKSFDKVAAGRAFEAGLDCGVHVQTCGHYLHIDCHQSYFKSLQEEHIRNFSYEQLPFDIQKGYFTCPLCRQPCNGVLPVLSDVIRKREAKRNLTSSDKCLAEISSLLQRYSEAGHLTSLTAKALEFTVLTASATTFVSRLSNTLKSEGHPSTALYSDRTIKEKFLILVSTVRTCLELDAAESDIGIRQRDAKRSCIGMQSLSFFVFYTSLVCETARRSVALLRKSLMIQLMS
eukprot:gene14545-5613_t